MDDPNNTAKRLNDSSCFSSMEFGLISLDSQYSRKRRPDLSPIASLFPKIGVTEVLLGLESKVRSRILELEGAEENSGERSFEEGMLRQILQWLNQGEEEEDESVPSPIVSRPFTSDELVGIYELARLYYETGYLTAAERILNGLVLIDEGLTPSRGALGVVKLESGKSDEAVIEFRVAAKSPRRGDEILVGKLGLIAAFLSVGDLDRAATLVMESESDLSQISNEARDSNLNGQRAGELGELWQAFAFRCGVKRP